MAGLDFAVLQKHLAADSINTVYAGLTGMQPDTLADLGGFAIALKPRQVLLIPPGMVIVEVSLSASNIVSWWNWLQPDHVPELLQKAPVSKRLVGVRAVTESLKWSVEA